MTIAGFPGREGCGSEYTLESLAVNELRLVVGVGSFINSLFGCRLGLIFIAVRQKVFQFAEHQACDARNFLVYSTLECDILTIRDRRRGRAGFFGFVAWLLMPILRRLLRTALVL